MSTESVFDRLAHEAYFHISLSKWQRKDAVQTGSDGKPQWTVRVDAEGGWADGSVVPDIGIEGSKRWIGELQFSVALCFMERWRELEEPAVGQLSHVRAIDTSRVNLKEQLALALMVPMELLAVFDRQWGNVWITVTLKDLELRVPDHGSSSGFVWNTAKSPHLFVSEFIVSSPVMGEAAKQ